MNARKVSLYKIAVGVAFVVIAATSCKSKNDDAPAPVNPYADMLPYLPSAISDQYNPLDSFVYNNDNTVASMFTTDGGVEYVYRLDFTYDQSGRCTFVKRFENGTHNQTNTITYDGLKVTEITSYPTAPGRKKDTAQYLFDKHNMLAQIESKDTIRYENGTKEVNFAELSGDGSNILSLKFHNFYSYLSGPDNTEVKSRTYDQALTFGYDTKKNALQLFFARNPLMGIVLNWEGDMQFAMGKNNIISVVEKDEASNEETRTYNYTVQNTFDEKTGLLTKSVATQAGNENVNTYNFSYTPAK